MDDLWHQLAAPFALTEVQWRVESLSKDQRKALVVAYIDVRSVLDRLDKAVGGEGWQDRYEVLQAGSQDFAVKCTLQVMEISKEDVGEGDSLKAAFSDALKRAAVKFGVGRYLYRLEKHWVEYDPESGRFSPPSAAEAESQPAPETAAEPPKPEPQELIDRLMERLKESGLGKQAALIVTRYGGYGKTSDDTRRLYGELRALLKGQP